ncbi:hypothetical protein [Erythrobacter sp. MTPC3]|uniref:hypothetical protein n=1 Tax=Erythrobacter sp. MTPC3 TaxID=3056564 RepID=UPI0036F23956
MRLAALAFSISMLSYSPQLGAAAQHAEQPSHSSHLLGTWSGPFAGYVWVIELYEESGALSGRYKTEGDEGWVPLRNVVYAGDVLEFQFVSARDAKLRLRLDSSGDVLQGNYILSDFPPMSLKLNRME